MAQRSRRTTVMSGKNINEILNERDSMFENQPEEASSGAVIEETKEEYAARQSLTPSDQ